MRGELVIRHKGGTDDDWRDAYEYYGISLTAESQDLLISGEPMVYSYQRNDSNERDVIFIRDNNGRLVRECAEIHLLCYIKESAVTPKKVMEVWEDFINFVQGYELEVKLKAGGITNFYTCEGELTPVPTFNEDGSVRTLSADVVLKQLRSYNTYGDAPTPTVRVSFSAGFSNGFY